MRTDRLMLAAFNSDAAGPIVPCIGTDPSKRFSLQSENKRRAKLERTSIECAVDCSDCGVVLPEAVPRLSSRLGLGICY
jgi:hypothetical protein